MGNLCAVASKRDILPYLQLIKTQLRASIIDTNPEVRATAAKGMSFQVFLFTSKPLAILLKELVKNTSQKLFLGFLKCYSPKK